MVVNNVRQSCLHSVIAVVLGIMSTGDHKVDCLFYFNLSRWYGESLKESRGWFHETKPCKDERSFVEADLQSSTQLHSRLVTFLK